MTGLLCRRKDGRGLIRDAEDHARSRAESSESKRSSGVKSQAGSLDLSSDTELADALGAKRRVAAAGVHAAVYFTYDVYGVIDANDAGKAIKQHVVLRKPFKRCGQDAEADVAKDI